MDFPNRMENCQSDAKTNDDLNNYRLISVILTVAKIFE